MSLTVLLIALAPYALVGTHLFIMNRWLRDESGPHPIAPNTRTDPSPDAAAFAATNFAKP